MIVKRALESREMKVQHEQLKQELEITSLADTYPQ